MKEDIFFKVGYTTYLQKQKIKKEKWTSKLIRKIKEHKIIFAILMIIIICMITNIVLIYKFINILEMDLS